MQGPNLNAARRLAAIDLLFLHPSEEEMVLPGLDQIISMARTMV
jgi:hypothetical protein